jgi:hypothetical protein
VVIKGRVVGGVLEVEGVLVQAATSTVLRRNPAADLLASLPPNCHRTRLDDT